jgi:hypothetical protein
VLDADLASGALYKGAERDDFDRLESVKAVDGRYRLRIQNDLEEIDHVDSLSLLVVDSPSGTEVLPTPTGKLVAVRGATLPRSSSPATPMHDAEPREAWTFEFARPRSRDGQPVERALLVVRGHTTPFAERAFMQYMSTMGQGVRPLLEMAGGSEEGCPCYPKYLAKESERLGLPLDVSIAATTYRTSLAPVSPAIARSQALVVDLPPDSGADRVTVRLEATPKFWEIDKLELAPFEAGDEAELDVREITPAAATTASGRDALALLRSNDAERVVLRPGERVDVEFDAPPASAAPDRVRTVIAKMRGFYEVDFGGQKGVDITRIVAYRAGWTSLPKFAKSLD